MNLNLRHQFENGSHATALLGPALDKPTQAPDTRPLTPEVKVQNLFTTAFVGLVREGHPLGAHRGVVRRSMCIYLGKYL